MAPYIGTLEAVVICTAFIYMYGYDELKPFDLSKRGCIDEVSRRVMQPSIKYVMLFLANFLPPSPCHTLSHIPGPPESTSHISDPPIFRRPSTKNPDKSPLVRILSQLF